MRVQVLEKFAIELQSFTNGLRYLKIFHTIHSNQGNFSSELLK